MVVVENTPKVHNLVVCTLCSCYPWPVLGLPPVWYKSAPYRSRAVIDPRGVLREFGLELPEDVEVRVWDSTAEVRYLVLARAARRHRAAERGSARRAGHARCDDRCGQGSSAAGRRPSMNGVHDMGGMQDMGPIQHEKNEPVFHARWEGRVWALSQRDGSLAQVEHRCFPPRERVDPSGRIPPHELLRTMVRRLVELTGQERLGDARGGRERQAGDRDRPRRRRRSLQTKCPRYIANGTPKSRDVAVAPRFQTGQRVRARNIHPIGHTRLPRYARGKVGTIERDHGVFVFPDTQRAVPRREAAARLLRALRGARAVGRAGEAAGYRLP